MLRPDRPMDNVHTSTVNHKKFHETVFIILILLKFASIEQALGLSDVPNSFVRKFHK